ncbi:hypothetical protein RJ639_027095 [Escallonia herrerae]|uniref:Uncharacterized protein n=1 Tax=Escallonia herrerae TaxID=1293975 RepID=A0AA89BKC9_9ASTE|nr:hypothetical protein RJ639_027095 [Escallonia herrerae]
MKDNQSGILWHLNGCGRDADQLASDIKDEKGFWKTPEPECSVAVDDFADGDENQVRDSVKPCTIPSEMFERDVEFYTDKNVTECELPEMMVCYKENSFHVVKDICVDEGVPSEDKILIEDGKYDDGCLWTSLHLNGNNNHSYMTKGTVDSEFSVQDGLDSSPGNAVNKFDTKEKVDSDLLIPDGTKALPEDVDHDAVGESSPDGARSDVDQDAMGECSPGGTRSDVDQEAMGGCSPDGPRSDVDQDRSDECGSEDPMNTGEDNCNATDKSKDFTSSNMLSVEEFHAQSTLKSLLESSNKDTSDIEQSGQVSHREASPQISDVLPTDEDSDKSSPTKDLSYDSKVESGTITFDFDSCKPAASSGDEIPENVCEKPLDSENMPSYEDGFSGNLSALRQVHRGEGESSFSVAGPASGLITYSGPIAYSGSISLRSDSSTTSTRSFAFPILNTEWNASPVRMAKADRRHFRKHRGWRHGLLCCRF